MFITKKHISRRTVLQGMGAAISLPFLEAMLPAQTPLRQTAAAPKSRFACIEVVHGSAGSTEWGTNEGLLVPKKEGRDFDFGMIISPLEPFKDHLTTISMTDCAQADPSKPEEVGADHFRSAARFFLTAAHPKQTLGSDVYCGTSIRIRCTRRSSVKTRRYRPFSSVPKTKTPQAPAAGCTAACT